MVKLPPIVLRKLDQVEDLRSTDTTLQVGLTWTETMLGSIVRPSYEIYSKPTSFTSVDDAALEATVSTTNYSLPMTKTSSLFIRVRAVLGDFKGKLSNEIDTTTWHSSGTKIETQYLPAGGSSTVNTSEIRVEAGKNQYANTQLTIVNGIITVIREQTGWTDFL